MLRERLLLAGLAGARLTFFPERRKVKPKHLMRVINRAGAFDT